MLSYLVYGDYSGRPSLTFNSMERSSPTPFAEVIKILKNYLIQLI